MTLDVLEKGESFFDSLEEDELMIIFMFSRYIEHNRNCPSHAGKSEMEVLHTSGLDLSDLFQLTNLKKSRLDEVLRKLVKKRLIFTEEDKASGQINYFLDPIGINQFEGSNIVPI